MNAEPDRLADLRERAHIGLARPPAHGDLLAAHEGNRQHDAVALVKRVPELADKEDREARLLAVYLPAQADEGAIRAAVAAFVAEQGLSGPAAMGPVMKEMKARFGASADGATLNRIAREVLAGR